MMPKISVVIPVYNKEKYLKETIKSVLYQDFKDFELIIINDGSTDRSENIIQSFHDDRIRYYKQKNQGVAIARNNGVEKTTTNLIAFLDGDDIWLKNHLEEIWQMYQNFDNADFFATAYQIKYARYLKEYIFNFEKEQTLIDKFYRYDRGCALFFMSNFAVKKDVFEQVGGFRKNIHAEDTEFFIRLGSQHPMVYSKNITMIHLDATDNSLFAQYKLEEKIRLLDFFKEQEKKDADLKTYLDIHRYVWSIEYLLVGKSKAAKELKKEIDFKNLNFKQKVLLSFPPTLLKNLKKIQFFLRKKGIILTAFSKK